MYPSVIRSAMHAATRCALAITALLLGINLRNITFEEENKRGSLQQGLSGFSFRQVDICASNILENPWSDDDPFNGVINLAARAGVRQSLESPDIYVDTNVRGALNLLEFSRRHGVEKFIQASSSSVYGANNVRPYREDGNTTRPLSPYAATKKASEALCYSYHHVYGLDVTVPSVSVTESQDAVTDWNHVAWIARYHPV
jgi:nucleoside-diphosphate-sugar epimerase